MSERYDAIVVGAGHNGLVASAYLARSGARVLVLERSQLAGGAARCEETWPGYTISTASYVCSLFDPTIAGELELARHGFSAYKKQPASFTPLRDGRSLLLGVDAQSDAREIGAFSRRDVEGYAAFLAAAEALGAEIFEHAHDERPSLAALDANAVGDFRLPVASFLERFVETPVLAATLATDGLIGTYAGPRDSGTTYVLAHHYAGRLFGEQGTWGFVRGGMGALSAAVASAARAAGAEIRCGKSVAAILPRDGGLAVQTEDGAEFRARCVLSNADPHTTFLRLVGGGSLDDAFLARVRDWRAEGVSFKINLALGELPNFHSRPGTNLQPHHRATIHLAPDIEYQQRAHDDARRFGASRTPILECFMQTPTDPSLAPSGKHVLSIFAQYFPYSTASRWTADDRTAAARTIVETLAGYVSNLPDAIEEWDVLSPADIESRIGISQGHIFHGELLPGQIFEDRFDVRTPMPGLYLCGSGTHPGGCVTGVPGRRAARAVLADLQAVV